MSAQKQACKRSTTNLTLIISSAIYVNPDTSLFTINTGTIYVRYHCQQSMSNQKQSRQLSMSVQTQACQLVR